MRHARRALLAIGLVGLSVAALAQQPDKTGPKANVAAGRQLFHQRCSACHGINGDGDGTYEVGSYLPPSQTPAANLTTLTRRNDGVFPAARVEDAIYHAGPIPADGAPDMPGWGNVFYDLKSNPKAYQQRVRDLTAYIESIQTRDR